MKEEQDVDRSSDSLAEMEPAKSVSSVVVGAEELSELSLAD